MGRRPRVLVRFWHARIHAERLHAAGITRTSIDLLPARLWVVGCPSCRAGYVALRPACAGVLQRQEHDRPVRARLALECPDHAHQFDAMVRTRGSCQPYRGPALDVSRVREAAPTAPPSVR